MFLKNEGGLGVINLKKHNEALLMINLDTSTIRIYHGSP
jgi:hypothetical protein